MSPHNAYSETTITTIQISLRTTGEAMKLKNRFFAGRLLFAFRPDLDPLLALDTDLCPQKKISQKFTPCRLLATGY
jgi:hypothetical protein